MGIDSGWVWMMKNVWWFTMAELWLYCGDYLSSSSNLNKQIYSIPGGWGSVADKIVAIA